MFVDRSSKLTRLHAPRLEIQMLSTSAVTGDNTHRRLALYDVPRLTTSSSSTVTMPGYLLSERRILQYQRHAPCRRYHPYDTKPHHYFNTVFY